MQAPSPIPVFRPSYLTDGVEFMGSLTESPANVFYQTVNASIASLNRMQFSWRSVSDQLLVSPVMMLRFKIKVQCPQLWNMLTAYCNVHGLQTSCAAATDVPFAGNAAAKQIGVPAIQFADGDALSNVASSINLSFNGTSISLNRTNRWWRDYMRTQLASDDAARIYKAAGGCYNQHDARAVAVPLLSRGSFGAHDAAATPTGIAVGIVQDSGIAERTKNLFSLGVVTGTGAANEAEKKANTRTIQISYPVPVPPCNPWRGAPLPATCPYKNCPLAIPHFSAGGLDFLFQDFQTAFLRYLGTGLSTTQSAAVTDYGTGVGSNTSTQPVKISYVDKSAQLEIKYFRLSHTRTLKESYRFNIFQAQTFPAPQPASTAAAPFIAFPRYRDPLSAVDDISMPPVGKDNADYPTEGGKYESATHEIADATGCMVSADNKDKDWKIVWDTISLAQVPSFLLISIPKLGDSYTMVPCSTVPITDDKLGAKLKGSNAFKNASNNLSITKLKIVVNATSGAIDHSGDDSGFIDQERLYQLTRENCNSAYFKEGGFRTWRDYGCAVLLSSAQFAPGLQVCDGVSYPVSIRVEAYVENKAVGISSLDTGVNHRGEDAAEQGMSTKSIQLARDYIRAQGQVTALFTKVVLSTTETSASTNAMNFPLDSSERLMSAAGAMR